MFFYLFNMMIFDRYRVLRKCAKPEKQDELLSISSLSKIPYAALLHFGTRRALRPPFPLIFPLFPPQRIGCIPIRAHAK